MSKGKTKKETVLQPDPAKAVYIEWETAENRVTGVTPWDWQYGHDVTTEKYTKTNSVLWLRAATAEAIASAQEYVKEHKPEGRVVLDDLPLD